MQQSVRYPQLLGGRQGSFTAWDHKQTIAAANHVIRRLTHFGLTVSPSSRIFSAIRDLERTEKFNVSLGHGDPQTERLIAEATRTIAEQYAIVRDLQPPDDVVRERLRKMLGGKPVPIEGEHDPARDVQAELFAAVLLFGAEFFVRTDEPDLILGFAGKEIPVAVKRITSATNFSKRMRKARDQLRRSGVPGYIVVSADQFVTAAYEQDRNADISGIHYRKVAELTDGLRLDPNDNPVLGVFGISTSFRHVAGTQRDMGLGIHFHQRFVTWQAPDRLAQATRAGEMMAANLSNSIKSLFAKIDRPAL